jgi:glycosyltransferase involved in cell wall biosynthesis
VKTIVHVLPYLATGGTEKHVLTLCRRQSDRYDVLLLAPPGEILPEFQKLGIGYVEFPELTGNVIRKIALFKRILREIDRERGVDIVHVHAAHEFVRFSRKALPDTPILFHLSAHQGSSLSKAFNYWQSARISRRHADLLIAVSEEEKRIVTSRGFPEERVRVVYNGYEQSEGDDDAKIAELRERYGLTGCLVIGNLGRIHKTKRLDVLIEAFAKLKADLGGEPETKLLLIGDGPDRKHLQALVEKLGLRDEVHFTGFIPRGDRVLRILDIFVLPTTFEGCSNVLVEVMAKGLPVVTTDVPSVAWMFENGKSALLMEKNSIADLHDKLRRLVKDSSLRNRLKSGGLKRFDAMFTAEKMAREIDEIYRDCMR